jgi:hypothetical protein
MNASPAPKETLAAQMRKLTTNERMWVKALAENKSVPYEQAIPYVLTFRDPR